MSDADVLRLIPGQIIAAGSRNLPSTAKSTHATRQLVVNVPGIGRVRFTYKRMSHTKARSTHYFWTIEGAALISIGDQKKAHCHQGREEGNGRERPDW